MPSRVDGGRGWQSARTAVRGPAYPPTRPSARVVARSLLGEFGLAAALYVLKDEPSDGCEPQHEEPYNR